MISHPSLIKMSSSYPAPYQPLWLTDRRVSNFAESQLSSPKTQIPWQQTPPLQTTALQMNIVKCWQAIDISPLLDETIPMKVAFPSCPIPHMGERAPLRVGILWCSPKQQLCTAVISENSSQANILYPTSKAGWNVCAVGKLLHLLWRSKRLKRKRPGSKFTNRQMCFSSRVVGCVFERRQETVRPIYAVCREPISSAPKHIIQDCIVLQRFVFLQKGALYTKKHCIQSWECFCGFELYSAPSD